MLPNLVSALTAFAFSALLVPLAARAARQRKLLDVPNERSSHKKPTPRIGGVGIVLGAALGGAVTCVGFGIPISAQAAGLLVSLVAGAAVGFADDLLQLKTGLRLLLYLVCAFGAYAFGASIDVFHIPGAGSIFLGGAFGAVFSVLFIVWYTNLFNFMDGINGIAASTSLVTMGALSYLFGAAGIPLEASLAAGIAGASLGFLFYNFPKASVFMGDGGAVFIGLAAGALSLRAVDLALISTHGVVLLMFPFVFDATFTLIRRMVRRERFWAAHRTHVYQQLCDLGFSHARITGMYFIAAVACAVLGLAYHRLPLSVRLIALSLLIVAAFWTARYVIVHNPYASQPSRDDT